MNGNCLSILTDLQYRRLKIRFFVKHIYALAAAAGALVCCICVRLADIGLGYIAGFAVVFVLRLCAAHFRWDLPKARNVDEEGKRDSHSEK